MRVPMKPGKPGARKKLGNAAIPGHTFHRSTGNYTKKKVQMHCSNRGCTKLPGHLGAHSKGGKWF